MSRLSRLIADFCPDGVEYKTLGQVGVFLRGSSFQKKHFVDEGVPCIHYGQVHTKFNLSTDRAVTYLDASFAAKMKRALPGDLIIATTAEDDDAVGKAIAWLGDAEVVISNDAYIYRHQLDPKYMAYFFASDLFQEPKRQLITGTKVRRLNEKGMSKIIIPVPPVEVQREVVRILDEYTEAHDELVRQLEEEMRLREQQLCIARNQLLTFRGKVRRATLGELGVFYGGLTGKSKKDFGVGAPFVSYVQVYENPELPSGGFGLVRIGEGERQNAVSKGDFLITISSENREDVGMTCVVAETPVEETYLNSFCSGWRPNNPTLFEPSFLKHLLRGDSVRDQIRRTANGVTRFNISKPKLAKVELPIPEAHVQVSIAAKLDALADAYDDMVVSLTSERSLLSIGLAEFRNELLSFPEKAA